MADELGGKRIPNNGFGQPDVDHDYFAIQVKTFKTMPQWFAGFWVQTERDAAALDKVPLLALCHAQGSGYPVKRYAVVRMDDLRLILEMAGLRGSGEEEAA